METYHGHVRTPSDAIVLFEACRLGLLPRVQRRLSEKERQNIKSGSVFVWDEREAGMRRWTDGKSWSASRVSGSFLTYREMEGKRGGTNAFAPPVTSMGSRGGRSPNPDSDSDGMETEGPDGYRYKPDGLMKQSFSITTATHQKLHLISYYARSHPSSTNLVQPTQDPQLKHIRPVKGMYPESTVHEQQNVPVTRGPMMSMPGQHGSHHGPHHGSHHGSNHGSPGQPYPRQNPSSHPVAFPQQSSGPYAWPPSPVSTPPTGPHFPPQHAYPAQPSPHTYSAQPSPHTYSTQPSPHMYHTVHTDRSPLPPHHRNSMGSPMMLHEQSPRNTPPTMLPQPPMMPTYEQQQMERYHSSPANSVHSRSPARSENGGYDMNPLQRHSPAALETERGLDVQDIPNDKIGFREDMRALKILNKAFVL